MLGRREKPRRNEGRIQHKRMKPKVGAPPTAEERRHMDRVAAMPCLVSRLPGVRLPGLECKGRLTVHHVTSDGMKRTQRSHRWIVPLCEAHHQHDHGQWSVERIGHARFAVVFGINLLAEAVRLWDERDAQ